MRASSPPAPRPRRSGIDARYRLSLIHTKDGRSLTGIIQDEAQNSVTLRQPFAGETTVQRSDIDRLQSLEQSMTPEGLEEGVATRRRCRGIQRHLYSLLRVWKSCVPRHRALRSGVENE